MNIKIQDNNKNIIIDVDITSQEFVEVFQTYLDYLFSVTDLQYPEDLNESLHQVFENLGPNVTFDNGSILELMRKVIEIGDDNDN